MQLLFFSSNFTHLTNVILVCIAKHFSTISRFILLKQITIKIKTTYEQNTQRNPKNSNNSFYPHTTLSLSLYFFLSVSVVQLERSSSRIAWSLAYMVKLSFPYTSMHTILACLLFVPLGVQHTHTYMYAVWRRW